MNEVDATRQGQEYLRLPYGFARRHKLLVDRVDAQLHIRAVEPLPMAIASELTRATGLTVVIELIAADKFEKLLLDCYRAAEHTTSQVAGSIGETLNQNDSLSAAIKAVGDLSDLLEEQDAAPIIRLVNAMFAEAIQLQASDIHIENYQQSLAVRFRVDGILRTVVEPDLQLAPLLSSRIKLMAGLDIAQKALPQDGRASLTLGGREIDLRVSTLPGVHGERIVLRLLDKNREAITLSNLGMSPTDIAYLENILAKGQGVLLATGPTGSGKSTTLYAALAKLNDRKSNILTIEDPVEYQLEGVGQTQVNKKAGMSFARGLRAILRQDPDVVMVGEIRDRETIDIAVQASLTGHLVLSTLHTNSAAGAVTRMVDMGVPRFLLASALAGVVAQRLVRRLCSHCKCHHYPSDYQQQLLTSAGYEFAHLYTASSTGCSQCYFEGYRGRLGVYELLVVNSEIRELIHAGAPESEIVIAARANNNAMQQDILRNIAAGLISFEELHSFEQVL